MSPLKQFLYAGICLTGAVLMTGCAPHTQVDPPQPVVQPTTLCVGCDADEHGCRASAGYSWCAAENSCVRSWELEQAKGIDLRGANFQKYCSSKK